MKRLIIPVLLVAILILTGCTQQDPGYNILVQSDGTVWLSDDVSNALVTIPFSHHELHDGDAYYIKNFQDVTGAGTNVDFLFRVPNTGIWPHAQWKIGGEAEFNLMLYEGVTVSANGTAVPVYNNNRNSANTNQVLAFTGPTLAGGALGDGGQGGTLIWAGVIGSGRDATESRELDNEFIGKINTVYWYQITLVTAGTFWVDYTFNWYEHTPN